MQEAPSINKHFRKGWGIRFVIRTLSVFATAHFFPGVELEKFTTAIWVSIVLGVLNSTVRPLLIVLTIPLTFMTLGLFLLAIKAFVILMTSDWVEGFAVEGFWTAIGFGIVLTLISSILEGRIEFKVHKYKG